MSSEEIPHEPGQRKGPRLTCDFDDCESTKFDLIEDRLTGESLVVCEGCGFTMGVVVMSENETEDEWSPSCYDCGRECPRRHLQPTPVHIDHEDGGGYDRVDVPMCDHCRLQRNGHACEHCGELHGDIEGAYMCCRDADGRLSGEAPDCPECDRRMERGSWGYTATGEPTVEWAECEACGVAWGKYTGWHDLDAAEGDA